MSAEADEICGAEYRKRSSERVNRRNGYRPPRAFDTRMGTLDGEYSTDINGATGGTTSGKKDRLPVSRL